MTTPAKITETNTAPTGVPGGTGGESQGRKGLYGRYEPWEVLDGWRRQQLARGPDKVGPKSFDRPGKSDTPNVTLLMWSHVEGFFQSRDDLRRRLLLEQKDTPRFRAVDAEFEVWAKNHPFVLARLPADLGKSEAKEHQPIKLSAACEALGIKPNTVLKAILEGRGPTCWRPKGSPRLTTLSELERWRSAA